MHWCLEKLRIRPKPLLSLCKLLLASKCPVLAALLPVIYHFQECVNMFSMCVNNAQNTLKIPLLHSCTEFSSYVIRCELSFNLWTGFIKSLLHFSNGYMWTHVTDNGGSVVKCHCESTTNGVSYTLNCCSSVSTQTGYTLRKVMCRRKRNYTVQNTHYCVIHLVHVSY
jgi:hypothetical protein